MYRVFYKIYNNTWIKSIRQGLLKVQPIILINCMLIIMLNIDSQVYNQIMTSLLGINWKSIFGNMYTSMYMLTNILIIISISSALAKIRRDEKSNNKYIGNKLSTNIVGFIGIASAFIFDSFFNENIYPRIDANWTLVSIIISIIFSEVYIKIYYYILDRKKNSSSSYHRIVRQSFSAIWPATITIIILIGTTFILKNVYLQAIEALNSAIIYGGNGFLNDIKYIFLANLLWVIGGHGGDLVIHEASFNRLPVDTFCNIGGSGSTICLILAILIYSVNRYSRKIAKISIIPSIFNINETVMYGLPILFNPIYIIPFVLVPVVSYMLSYISIKYGVVEVINTNVSWIDPIILNSYTLTGSYGGVILQIINIIIGIAIYIPFVKISDNINIKEKEIAYKSLKEEVFSGKIDKLDLSVRPDGIGEVGTFLGLELKKVLNDEPKKDSQLYIEYQPQLNRERKVVGVEALLRWNYKEFGHIPPNIIVIIAEELGLIYDLGKWVAKEAISQLAKWNNELDINIDMSINASTKQLTDKQFSKYIIELIDSYNINSNNIKIELTENFAVGEDDTSKNQLKELTDYGVRLAIDDFGVGYNPILYIKKYKIDSIKIDGSLIKDIDENEESRSIVSAMYNLCESTDIKIVNEFVETEAQKEILDSMGDGLYQGYLFSKPLPDKECLDYIKNNI